MTTPPDDVRRSVLDRLLAAYPLLLAYIVLLVLYAWQTTKHSTPWNFTDELKWAMLSRSIAHTGHGMLQGASAAAGSLYAYFLAPAWWAGATAPSYAAAKYLNAAVMTASLVPAYALGRLYLPRIPAVFAALATASIPALAYTGLLIPEPLAYFWSTLALYLLARALLRPTWSAVALAIAATIIAPFVRSQLVVVVFGAVLAAALVLVFGDRARALIGSWTRSERFGAVVLLIGGIVFADVYLAQHSYEWFIGTHFWHRAFTYGLWAVGSFTIGVGIVPVLLALTWMLGGRRDDREDRALLALLISSVVAFVLYAAVKASYESTIFSIRVWERNLIYIAPIVFVVAARCVAAGRPRVLPLVAAAAATGYLLASTPYHAYEHFYSDAPGLSILQWLNRTWSFTITDLKWLLFGILAYGVALALAVGRRSQTTNRVVRHGVAGLISATAIAVIAWNLTGEITAANSSNSFAKTIVALPSPPDWIDRATGRERTLFVGQGLGNSNQFWSIEFWNQSIQDVWTVDGSSPGLGQTWTPNFAGVDGEVSGPRINDRWGIASGNITLAGRPKELAGGLQLYALDHPIRITSFTSNVSPDGWMGDQSSFVVFGKPGDPPGTALVTVSRQASCGDIAPARLTIRLTRLRIDENAQPVAGHPLAAKHVVVRSNPCQRFPVPLQARPPFRIDVSARGFFRPADGRKLSVQIGYTFTPDKR
ncbi:MAG: hypothetical protein JWO17_607 [Actinomycetia bacterium]|nr:hypothetical protein [Actinomycetes bacterium]